MKVQQVLYSILLAALVLPMAAGAQIYKWKDKNGVMRYSDTPPPPNVEVKTIGQSAKDPYAKAKAPEAAGSVKNSEAGAVAPPDKKTQTIESGDPQQEQARKAELEKQKSIADQKKKEAYAENCKTAKANYESFMQGGRMYKMNEQGEKVYLDEAGIADGKAKAQAEINQYCK